MFQDDSTAHGNSSPSIMLMVLLYREYYKKKLENKSVCRATTNRTPSSGDTRTLTCCLHVYIYMYKECAHHTHTHTQISVKDDKGEAYYWRAAYHTHMHMHPEFNDFIGVHNRAHSSSFQTEQHNTKMCADEDATTTKLESHRISVLFAVSTSSSLHFNFMNRRCCVWRRRVVKGKRQSRGLNAHAVWMNYVLRSVLRWATSQRASRLPKKAKESSHPRSAVPCIVIFGRTRVCVIWICVQYMNGYDKHI